MSLLEVRDLTISFKNIKAVDGISFDIHENEVLGLVGESGSGKTITGYSIMNILPKEAKAESAGIKFNGKKIGIVFQEPFTSLNPVLRVGRQIDEIFIAHEKASKRKAKEKSLELLEKVKIDNPGRIYDNYPHQLSGGQRQRIIIAMAIALKPELLIADEPTTALDVTIQSGILQLLRRLKKDLGLSILFITHDFAIVNEMADRVLVMKRGLIVEEGPKDDILSKPKNEYTKKLINAIPKIPESTVPFQGKRTVLVEAKNLYKSYAIESGFLKKEIGKVQAVRNVSIQIEKGKTLGLVGESGCGKSTLGRLLLGIEKPDKGNVLINGKLPDPKVRRMLQIVFQDPYSSLDPRMAMGEIVLEGLSILGTGKRKKDKALKDMLEKVKLSFEDRFKYPHQFSGGQRQRIAIARALAVNPQFIVLDEPVSSLDVIIQKEILDLLKELKNKLGLTYLFISHDLRVVESFSDTVSVMCNGEIVETAPRDEIYRNPKHPYTKKLLNSILAI